MNKSSYLHIIPVTITLSLLPLKEAKATLYENFTIPLSIQVADTPLIDIANAPFSSESMATLNAQLPEITTKVFLSFCEEEMEIKFTPKEKTRLSGALITYFTTHPLCSLDTTGNFQWYLTPAYMEDMAHTLMPYFIEKLARYYKLGVSLIGGNEKVWNMAKKDLKSKKLPDAKITFIKDIGSAFKKLDAAVAKSCAEKDVPFTDLTITEYYGIIMRIFPNENFTNYINTLDKEYLNKPISNLVYEEK
jgi:hypothetical protein